MIRTKHFFVAITVVFLGVVGMTLFFPHTPVSRTMIEYARFGTPKDTYPVVEDTVTPEDTREDFIRRVKEELENNPREADVVESSEVVPEAAPIPTSTEPALLE